jgi:hypothetical protein
MSRIFLSHSSRDDSEAVAVAGWLNENGWDDVFLDLDPNEGIPAGERWERSLYEHAARCEAVLFLVSHNWLSSEWCRREYELARKLNKRIFVVLIEQLTIQELPSYLTQTHQAVSLASGEDHQIRRVILPGTQEERHVTFSNEGLARLKAGLAQAGLDPRFFAWPPANEPDRAPYRGLEPLEAVDAGIFFGREAPVIEALDGLRGLREGACPRLFVLLGASGAGKSSFLRAGLLPRLARDDRSFLPLPVVRPARSAITGVSGFVAALAAACAEKGMTTTRAQLRDAAEQGADALRPCLRELATRAGSASAAPKPPTLIIAVDQAEELFRAEGAQESEALLTLLRDLVQIDDPAVIALFAIRSDSYDALEHAKPLEALSQKAFPLLPMPRSAYRTVIEGPAQRFERAGRKFEIDPSLTEALLADLEKGGGSDALPLLAFTLEQLFYDNKAAGRLSRTQYENFGGLKGAIEAALARVFTEAEKDPRIPKDHDARLALLRRGLIPWLAGIDPDTKTPRRRRAPASQIPEEARPLVDLLVEQRLLTRAVDDVTHAVTIEPAHEALLRQWGSLKGWLDEDFVRLVTLEGVKRAARDWDANARDKAWAAHGGARLDEAARLDTRADLAALLDETDRAYLAACVQKQNEAIASERALAAAERRAGQRTRIGLAVSAALAVIAILAAVYGFYQAQIARQRGEIAEQRKQDAEQQALKAEQRSAVLAVSVAQAYTAEGALDQALLLMLDAARVFDDASVPDHIRIALTKALQKRERVETKSLFPNIQAFETDEALLLVDPATNDIWKLTESIDPQRTVAGSPDDRKIVKLRSSGDGKEYIILRENLDVERINAASGVRKRVGTFPDPKKRAGRTYEFDETKITDDGLVVRTASLSENGKWLNYFQALNSETGNMIEGELAGSTSIVRKRAAGGLYAFDTEKKQMMEVTPAGDQLLVKQASLSGQESLNMRYGDCVARMANVVKQKVVADLKNDLNPGGTFECKKVGGNYLIAVTNSTSAGPDRSDMLYQPDGKKIDVRETVEKLVSGGLSGNNLAWVGGSPPTETLAARLKTKWLAVLLNRNAYVISKADDSDSWSLVLDFRHPAAVEQARFVGSDRLVVVDAEKGRLFEHQFGGEVKKKLLATSVDGITDSKTPVQTLHRGTCVGYAIPRSEGASMPDGRKISFEAGSITQSSEKHEIRVSGVNETVIPLAAETSCLQFSADWSRMLTVNEKTVVIYDFRKILERGKLEGAEIGTLPIATSAFFAGPVGEKIVTADYTNSVRLWSQRGQDNKWASSEIYKGDNPVKFAEPDANGDRIIILEDVGGGAVHGLLYSVGARDIWYDLGSDYKWLGAAFTNNSEVVVAEHWEWNRTYPVLPLSRLVEIAEPQLSSECRAPSPKQYRQSPCWPASR